MKFGENICSYKNSAEFKLGHMKTKTMSIGQIKKSLFILEKSHLCRIFLKLGQNICSNDISEKFENKKKNPEIKYLFFIK